ncbi:hypothetical protein BRADI_1g31765v3 [Brachypodium distachyon]|uniref:Cathepsin propeptide inhibitor domain-containing protein n=1 Tax=Brachypodium distachyon TaxID=15368 RepID=A0A2K2DMB3_BRADI|nr:hypothetical protein BRADI_1g31765v3 [Brachypodium distachyon]
METRRRGQGAGGERAAAGMETRRRAVAPVSTEEAEGVELGNGGHGRSVGLLFTYALLLLFARAARSAAAATYRVASLAERRALSPGPGPAAAVPTHGTAAPSSKGGGMVEFMPKEEDLESDEAVWRLYERWCKDFNQKREPDEMARRFNKFKNRVLRVRDMNNSNADNPQVIQDGADQVH